MSEKLLIERLKSLAEEVRGPVKDAMLDAAMALTEADALAARLAEVEQAIDSAGKCLVMSNNGAREALEILQRYKRTADSATAGRE